MRKRSGKEPLKYYQWGTGCEGWVLVDEPSLSVKKERMPAGTSEQLHYHREAQQFFFILKGIASFEIDKETIEISEQEGIHIRAGEVHRISNHSTEILEFLLSSEPSTINDRYNV